MIVPAGHRVIVKPKEIEKKEGSVWIPDTARDRMQLAVTEGEIIAIGENAWKAFDTGKPWAKVGDKVIYARYGGCEVEENGQKYRILNDEDIIAIIK